MHKKETWLITGGAGYIGSHIANEFISNGKDVVIYDSLFHGLESRVEYLCRNYKIEIPLIVADIRNTLALENTILKFKPEGIIHTAALKSVEESIKRPSEYLEVNFEATKSLLEIAFMHKVKHFIFSSTAAVYGSPSDSKPVKEADPTNPISPYGTSKLMAEGELNKFLAITDNRGASLRFFNVVGTAAPELQDNSTDNLVPIVINNLKSGTPPTIFGTDYPTTDGTCIRDYIDVRDVARAHFETANSRLKLPHVLNVGTGRGASVREVIRLVGASAGRTEISTNTANRRVGDPASLCADTSLLKSTIAFMAEYSLEESIKSLR